MLIVSGLGAFVLMLLFDIFSMYKKNVAKYISGFGGLAILVLSTIALIQSSAMTNYYIGYRIFGMVFSVLFFGLTIYSIFIEVGKNTYEYNSKPRLITTGTYALSRHPGVLWLLLFFTSLALLFGSTQMLLAGLIWSLTNTVYVVIQERFIFKRIFENYRQYCESTPMLVPNISSMKRFANTIIWRKR